MLTVNVKTLMMEHVFEAKDVIGNYGRVSGHVDWVVITKPDGETLNYMENENPSMSIFVMNEFGKTVASYQFCGDAIRSVTKNKEPVEKVAQTV